MLWRQVGSRGWGWWFTTLGEGRCSGDRWDPGAGGGGGGWVGWGGGGGGIQGLGMVVHYTW